MLLRLKWRMFGDRQVCRELIREQGTNSNPAACDLGQVIAFAAYFVHLKDGANNASGGLCKDEMSYCMKSI